MGLRQMWRLGGAALLCAGSGWAMAATTSFGYADFSDVSGLQLNGSAVQAGTELRLTGPSPFQGGSVFSRDAITLGVNTSFSTAFSFVIREPGGLGNGADGLTFTLQTNASTVGGAGGGIGYEGLPNSITLEFDTFDNGEPGGSNHVALALNGATYNPVATTGALSPDFDNGETWHAWIDYNGATGLLEARWSQSAARPADAGLSFSDTSGLLPAALAGQPAYVGFTSGTGAGWGQHNILSWQFVADYAPITTPVPEPGTWAMLASGSLVVAACAMRRRRTVSA